MTSHTRGRRDSDLTESEYSSVTDRRAAAGQRDNRARARTATADNRSKQRPDRAASAAPPKKETQTSKNRAVKSELAKAPTKQSATPLRASKTTDEVEEIQVQEDDSGSYYTYTDSEAKEPQKSGNAPGTKAAKPKPAPAAKAAVQTSSKPTPASSKTVAADSDNKSALFNSLLKTALETAARL